VSGNPNIILFIYELSGADQTGPHTADGSNSTEDNNVDPTVTLTVPDAKSTIIAIGAVIHDVTEGNFTAGDGLIEVYERGAGTRHAILGYEEVASSGSNTVSAAYSENSLRAGCLAASYKGS
jgi:hypothetical protein